MCEFIFSCFSYITTLLKIYITETNHYATEWFGSLLISCTFSITRHFSSTFCFRCLHSMCSWLFFAVSHHIIFLGGSGGFEKLLQLLFHFWLWCTSHTHPSRSRTFSSAVVSWICVGCKPPSELLLFNLVFLFKIFQLFSYFYSSIRFIFFVGGFWGVSYILCYFDYISLCNYSSYFDCFFWTRIYV